MVIINRYSVVEQILIIRFVHGVVLIHFQRLFQMKILFPEMENVHIIVNILRYIILLILVNILNEMNIKFEWFILGELYSATSNEPIFGVNDPLIQRSFSQGKQLRTQQHDSNWLKSKF